MAKSKLRQLVGLPWAADNCPCVVKDAGLNDAHRDDPLGGLGRAEMWVQLQTRALLRAAAGAEWARRELFACGAQTLRPQQLHDALERVRVLKEVDAHSLARTLDLLNVSAPPALT
jgi:hypothetical protein